MKILSRACGLAAPWALVLALPLASASGPTPTKKPADRYQPYVKINGLFFDNFFQTPESLPGENLGGVGAEAGVAVSVRGSKALKAYGNVDYLSYHGFGPSSGITGGLRLAGKPHAFDAYAQYLRGRPSRDAGDVVSSANVAGIAGEYSYRVTSDVELSGLADYRHQSYQDAPLRANDVHNFGLAVRYRGLGHGVSPEAGFRRGGRVSQDPNEDLSQRELFVKLRWTANPSTYLTLRYRHRRREYTTALPQARNFGREDTRVQWTLSADLEQSEELSWNLYYALEDSDSTRPAGAFKTQALALGLTLRF